MLELAEITDQPAQPLHPDWHDELVRRVRSVKDGTAVLHDWEDVEREVDEIILEAAAHQCESLAGDTRGR